MARRQGLARGDVLSQHNYTHDSTIWGCGLHGVKHKHFFDVCGKPFDQCFKGRVYCIHYGFRQIVLVLIPISLSLGLVEITPTLFLLGTINPPAFHQRTLCDKT
ncbi:hypothetical protein J6590_034163 [Homalodisca vitripennis]|nr:hypothetical protein J6590_034163 [Homalodisca vitripennis]